MTNICLGLEPEEICDTHLTSSHAEIHQEIGLLNSGNISAVMGHVRHGFFCPKAALKQHQALHQEAQRRGSEWCSPLPELSTSMFADAGLVCYPFPFKKANRVRMASKNCRCLER